MLKVFSSVLLPTQRRIIYHPLISSKMSFRKRLFQHAQKRIQEQERLMNLDGSSKNVKEQKQQQFLTEKDRQIINAYKVDKMWNIIIKEQPSKNFQKDLIIYKKQYENSTKQLREAILFQDLLKTEIDITIYDTKGKPFVHRLLRLFYIILSIGASLWSINALKNHDPKDAVLLEYTTMGRIFKWAVYSCCLILCFIALFKYGNFIGRYVEKVVYNTQKQEFTFTKRSIFSRKYETNASRFKIIYTENKFLNEKGTNYFHIDTKQQYSIIFKDFWIKQDLFSHLISQRIKT